MIGATTWQEVSEILADALERPAEERAAFLEERCGGDVRLKDEVEALLAVDTASLAAADRPVFEFFGESDSQPTVGPYQLLREIGRGGMATVYLARSVREDSPPPVAVKILKRGMDSDSILHLFRREGEILARLRHPNIAALHGGGTTAEHRPYLVMEYVDGEPVDEFCRHRSLSLSQRLDLFLRICDTVQYAHRNLVVHRDLKPRNILVTPTGEPKLLDFGISKWLYPESRDQGPVTATVLRVLTPEYASPEQIRGERPTVACDVYALGVILLQILTGRLPFEGAAGERPASEAMLRRALEEEAPRASSLVEGGSPRRKLKGDLDNIVAKALRKEPEQRYPSVERFADDLRCFLAHRPVSANAGSLLYRAKKALRRHQWPTAVAVVLLLSIAGALVQRELQRRSLRLERDRAVAVQDFLIEVFGEADPGLGKDGRVEVGEVLIRGVQRIDRLAERPLLQVPLLTTLGEIYLNLGRLDEAEPLLRRALALAEEHFGSASLELAKGLDMLGQLLTDTENLEEAESALRRSEEIYRRSQQTKAQVSVLSTLAVTLREQSRFDEAEKICHQALDILRRSGLERSPTHASVLNNLGFIAYDRMDFEGAKRFMNAAQDLRRATLGDDHKDLAIGLNNLASLSVEEGDYELAKQQFEEAERIFSRFLDPNNLMIFTAQVNRASALFLNGEAAAVVELLEPLSPRLEESLGRQVLWIRANLWLVQAYEELGRREESQALAEQISLLCEEQYGETHPITSEALYRLARVKRSGDPALALRQLRRVRDLEVKVYGEDHPSVLETEELIEQWEQEDSSAPESPG